jgi:uncharacterized repeat protein (TIGR01451 family)
MGRVVGFLDVRTSIKIAVTVAVALLAFGAMANPAWAQDTTLSVDKSADRDPALAGKVLTYTVVVTNTGANQAENVTLSDVLELGTVDVVPDSLSVSTTQGSCLPLSGTFVSCTLGSLGVGESATVTVRLEPTSQGTITNTAVAGADNAAVVADDSVSTAVVPDLVIDKSVSDTSMYTGGSLTYILRVTNQGETPANDVVVTDALPLYDELAPNPDIPGLDLDSIRFTSDDFSCEEDAVIAGLIRCEGSLAAGETGTVEIFVEIPDSLENTGNLENTAEVRVQGVPTVISSDTVATDVWAPVQGEEPGNDVGQRVLVSHKGKELCLPEAALHGHLKHGDEVIDEEGCSNAEDGSRRGLR